MGGNYASSDKGYHCGREKQTSPDCHIREFCVIYGFIDFHFASQELSIMVSDWPADIPKMVYSQYEVSYDL